jgi:Na+-transporting methylmalonyl-CoA/oxaloacetate decarboxylase gamma subunit
MFHPEPGLISAGFQVMIYGLVGVFIVLILFYLVTKAMVYFFSKLEIKRKAKLAAARLEDR